MDKLRHILAAVALITSCLGHPAFAATAVAPPPSGGERPKPKCRNLNVSNGVEELLSGVAANASASTRTVTVVTEEGWTDLGFQLNAVEAGTITGATMTMTCSRDHGVTFGNVDTVEPAGSGGLTQYSATWTKGITATGNVLFDVDISKCDKAAFVFGLTGGGASDTITVYGKMCAI